jgi:hypothetical protein
MKLYYINVVKIKLEKFIKEEKETKNKKRDFFLILKKKSS